MKQRTEGRKGRVMKDGKKLNKLNLKKITYEEESNVNNDLDDSC